MTNKISEKINISLRQVSIIIPMVYMCIMYFSNCIYYSESDDGMMNSIARGYFTGKKDVHLVFINTTYGYLTKILYKITDSVNWFAIIYLLLVIICVYLIWFIFSRYINYWISLCVAISLESLAIFYFTFTTISFVCSFTGLIVLIDFVKREKKYTIFKRTLFSITIVALCCFGFIIRKEPFLVTVFLVTPTFLISAKKIVKSKLVILIVAITLVGAVSLNYVNAISYKTSLWKNYSKYNTARSKAIDYPIAKYEENQKLYEEKGLSKNDLSCLSWWIFGDKKVYSEQTLNEIVEKTPTKIRYNFNPLTYRVITYYKLDKYLCYLSLLGFVIFAFYLIACLKSRRKIYILQSIILLIYLVYLGAMGRTVAHVVLPAILITSLFTCYSIITHNESKQVISNRFNRKLLFTIIICATCGFFIAFNSLTLLRSMRISAMHYENNQIKQYLRSHNNSLYLARFKGLILYNESVNKMTDKEIYPNLMQMGDQDIYNNLYYQQLKQLKVRKEYKNRLLMNLLYRKNSFMLCNKHRDYKKIKLVKQFLEEHTKRKVECRVVEKIKGTNTYVYQFK